MMFAIHKCIRMLFLACSWSLLLNWGIAQEPTPIQITSGSSEDVHPAFVSSGSPFVIGKTEWLAFTRLDREIDFTSICVATVAADSIRWPASVYYVISDSMAYDDFPSIARVVNPMENDFIGIRGMLVWQRKVENYDIYYSYYSGNSWSAPQALAIDPRDDQHPDVVAHDSSFGCVWEQEGRVLFSEYTGGGWSVPERITPAADSTDHLPRMLYLWGSSVTAPMVIWEKEKPADSTRAIMYSVRWDSSWSAPDTIAWSGDNRSARFTRGSVFYNLVVTWESNRAGKWDIYESSAEGMHDSLSWSIQGERSLLNTGADNHDFSSINVPIITNNHAMASDIYYASATWRVVSGTSDSIAVSRQNLVSYFTGAQGSENMSPTISSGVWLPNAIRVWSAWQSRSAGGRWKLYGMYTDISEWGVNDRQALPDAFSLYPNYPNPFNPMTTVSFVIGHSSFVSLRVYDLLGREVATLVNKVMQPGVHTIEWNPSTSSGQGFASGVYFYRLKAGPFTDTKKMLLLR